MTDIDYVPNQPIYFNFKSLQKISQKNAMNGSNSGDKKGEYYSKKSNAI